MDKRQMVMHEEEGTSILRFVYGCRTWHYRRAGVARNL
jgi:hypothetical protein